MKINLKSQAFVIEPSQENFFYDLELGGNVFRHVCHQKIAYEMFFSCNVMNCMGYGDKNHKWLLVRVSDGGQIQEGWEKHIRRNG